MGIAGRAIIRNDDGSVGTKLVRINKPVARIPNLAIHLTAAADREAFAFNLHENCKAILSMDPQNVSSETLPNGLNPCLATLVATECDISVDSIMDLDLQLIDLQPSCIGGASEELLFSGRLDNLCSSFQCVRAIIDTAKEMEESSSSSSYDRNVQMVLMFDHEEVGSNSSQGAGSSMFMDTLRRIDSCLGGGATDSLVRAMRKSFVVSIDMAHAHHPNYPAKHDPCMAPKINQGLVIKHNANQRYATNAFSAVMFKQFGAIAGLPMQEFSVRSDMGCGR